MTGPSPPSPPLLSCHIIRLLVPLDPCMSWSPPKGDRVVSVGDAVNRSDCSSGQGLGRAGSIVLGSSNRCL